MKTTSKQTVELVAGLDRSDRKVDLHSVTPGAGPVLAPRLLGALGADRDHFDSPESLQCYSGVAPVTKQSGKSRHVHRRLPCPLFIRQSFHEYASQSILWCRWAAAFYLGQRLKGKPHHTAVRALAFKWQRVIWRCWTDHTPYDDSLYEKVLRDRRSPVVKLFKNIVLGQNPFTHHDDNPKKAPSKNVSKSKISVDGSPQR
jgi:hypothetical protein